MYNSQKELHISQIRLTGKNAGTDPVAELWKQIAQMDLPGSVHYDFYEASFKRAGSDVEMLFSNNMALAWKHWKNHRFGQASSGVTFRSDCSRISVSAPGTAPSDIIFEQRHPFTLQAGQYNLALRVSCSINRPITFVIYKSHSSFKNPQYHLKKEIYLNKGENHIFLSFQITKELIQSRTAFLLGNHIDDADDFSFSLNIPWAKYYLETREETLNKIFNSMLRLLKQSCPNAHLTLSCIKKKSRKISFTLSGIPFTPSAFRQQAQNLAEFEEIIQQNKGTLQLKNAPENQSNIVFGLPAINTIFDQRGLRDRWDPIPRLALRIYPDKNTLENVKHKFTPGHIEFEDANVAFCQLSALSRKELLENPKNEISDFFPDFEQNIIPFLDDFLRPYGNENSIFTSLLNIKSRPELGFISTMVQTTVLKREASSLIILISLPNPSLSREMEQAAQISSDLIFILNEKGTILETNKQMGTFFGFQPKAAALRKEKIQDHFPGLTKELVFYNKQKKGSLFKTKLKLNSPDLKDNVIVEASFSSCPDHKNHIFLALRDITSEETEIEYLKTHDKLTRLSNFTALRDKLNQLVFSSSEDNVSWGLVLLAINDFDFLQLRAENRQIEELIKEIAQNLKIVSQISNGHAYKINNPSQFAFIFHNLVDMEILNEKLDYLLESLPGRFNSGKDEILDLKYSVGIVFYTPEEGIQDEEELLRKANYALKEASEIKHKTSICHYQNRAHTEYLKKVEKIELINWGLKRNRFETWFQPIGRLGWCIKEKELQAVFRNSETIDKLLAENRLFSREEGCELILKSNYNDLQKEMEFFLRSGIVSQEELTVFFNVLGENVFIRDIVGFESLLRMRGKNSEVLLPADFIHTAEETGQIVDVEWNVLPGTLKAASEWMKQYKHLKLSINLSAKLMRQPDFSRRMLESLEISQFDPKALNIEFVERDEIGESLLDFLPQYKIIKNKGVTFYSDDFGEGTNSVHKMSILNDVISAIKISVTFIQEMCDDVIKEQAVRALYNTGRIFQKDVIVEGVEEKEVLTRLGKIGPLDIQGYGISRPMPAEKVKPFLDAFYNMQGWEKVLFPLNCNSERSVS